MIPKTLTSNTRRHSSSSLSATVPWAPIPALLPARPHRHEVERREVLDELAEPNAARVRAHRHAELGGEQQHRDDLVHTAQPAGIDLAVVQAAGLQELLEHDPVVTVLAGGD